MEAFVLDGVGGRGEVQKRSRRLYLPVREPISDGMLCVGIGDTGIRRKGR